MTLELRGSQATWFSEIDANHSQLQEKCCGLDQLQSLILLMSESINIKPNSNQEGGLSQLHSKQTTSPNESLNHMHQLLNMLWPNCCNPTSLRNLSLSPLESTVYSLMSLIIISWIKQIIASSVADGYVYSSQYLWSVLFGLLKTAFSCKATGIDQRVRFRSINQRIVALKDSKDKQDYSISKITLRQFKQYCRCILPIVTKFARNIQTKQDQMIKYALQNINLTTLLNSATHPLDIVLNPRESQKVILEHSSQIFSQSKIMKAGQNDESNGQVSKCRPRLLQQLRYIQNINENLVRCDFMVLKYYWEDGLADFLTNLMGNWDEYAHQLTQQMIKFTKVIEFKMYKAMFEVKDYARMDLLRKKEERHSPEIDQSKEYINFYEKIYPSMAHIIKSLLKLLGLNSIPKDLQKEFAKRQRDVKQSLPNASRDSAYQYVKQSYLLELKQMLHINDLPIVDKLVTYFLAQQDTKLKKDGILLVTGKNAQQERVSLEQYMSNCQQFYRGSSSWSDALNQFAAQVKSTISYEKSHKEQEKQAKAHHFFHNSYKESLVEAGCLGCAKFFYQSMNIYDESVNMTPVKIFGSISRIKQYESEVKDEICGMLNGGGGTILFACTQQYRNIFVQGELITEKSKQLYSQRIESYLHQFYPRVELQNVSVTFVPVIGNPYETQFRGKYSKYYGEEAILKQNRYFQQRRFIQGLYVVRLRILASEPTQVYFWHTFNNKNREHEKLARKYSSIRSDGRLRSLTTRAITKLIKFKMKYFSNKQQDTQPQIFMKISYDCFSHKCVQPDVGLPIKEANKKQRQEVKRQFKNMSLIVAKKQNLVEIRDNFSRNEVRCYIQVLFDKENFKLAKTTAVVHHNVKHEDLQRVVRQNDDFLFNGKKPLLITVTNYLKLSARSERNMFTCDDAKNYYSWFKKSYPAEYFKVYEFKPRDEEGKKEYFITTQTKESTIYMYYLLDSLYEKTLLKNPLHIDFMDEKQRNQRMKLIFEEEGEGINLAQSFVFIPNQMPSARQAQGEPKSNGKTCPPQFDHDWQRVLEDYSYRFNTINLA